LLPSRFLRRVSLPFWEYTPLPTLHGLPLRDVPLALVHGFVSYFRFHLKTSFFRNFSLPDVPFFLTARSPSNGLRSYPTSQPICSLQGLFLTFRSFFALTKKKTFWRRHLRIDLAFPPALLRFGSFFSFNDPFVDFVNRFHVEFVLETPSPSLRRSDIDFSPPSLMLSTRRSPPPSYFGDASFCRVMLTPS